MLLRILCLFVLLTGAVYSQGISVTGKVVDGKRNNTLVGATVQLLNSDSVTVYHAFTEGAGDFTMDNVLPGVYTLKITYIAHFPFFKKIEAKSGKNLNLGSLTLKSAEIKTGQVTVEANSPIGDQKGDTTEINASSFKTLPDATAEDLVKKMPGIQVDQSGNVQAQGESVKKVTVDGKPFFGDDPTAALKNLPAEVIDKVQVYDKMSEQSEFTGFDDGNTQKTLNIITKKNKRVGKFGKFSGAYGDQAKYNASAIMNIFNGPERISLLGMSNNVNQQNFNIADILDAMGGGGPRGQMFRSMGGGRTGGSNFHPQQNGAGGGAGFRGPGGPLSNFFIGQQDGINNTSALGGNYSDDWGENIDVTGSYFFNYQKNNNLQNLNRQYFVTSDTSQFYNQTSNSTSFNINHRFNFRFNYQIDTNNSIVDKPVFTYQSNNANQLFTGDNLLGTDAVLNTASTTNNSNYSGYNFSNEFLFKHRFGVVGRTFSIDLNGGANNKNATYDLITQNMYNQTNGTTHDTLNQKTTTPNNGYSLAATAAYTEPIMENQQLMFSYSANYNSSNADNRTYNLDSISHGYDILDTLLSNKFDNFYFYQKAGLGYRLKQGDLNLTASLDYQRAELNSNQAFPVALPLNYVFYNLLPTIRLNYRTADHTNFFLFYRTTTNAPSVTQLQNVIDNRNSMQLSVGNPSLTQAVTNSISSRYVSFSQDFGHIFFTFLNLSYGSNYIANSTTIVQHDSIIQNNLVLPAGGQITKPVNMDGYWNAIAVMNYGFPIEFISSKMNVNVVGNYSKTPSLINNSSNFANAYSLTGRLFLTSNISQNVDFSISTSANYNKTVNTLRSDLNLNYTNFQNSANIEWIFWEGVFFQADVTNQFYTGIAPANSTFTLLNFSIGKKLFENDNGELKLSVFDALKQNRSTTTNLTDYYSESVYNNVLTRYVLLTFSYNLKKFGM